MLTAAVFLVLGMSALFSRFYAFSLFTVLTILFSRSFSHLALGVYVTEFFIMALIVSIVVEFVRRGKIRIISFPCGKLFVIFYLIMGVALIHGLMTYGDTLFVFRHSALFYYSIFFFLVPHIFNSWEKVETYLTLFFVTAVFKSFALFISMPWGINAQYVYYYAGIALMFLMVLLLQQRRVPLISLRFLGMLVLFCAVVMSMARAAWIGVAAVILFTWLAARFDPLIDKLALRIAAFMAGSILVGAVVLGIVRPAMLGNIFDEAKTIFPGYTNPATSSSNNTTWRLYVWKDIIRESMEKPLMGWGFGRKFVPPTIKQLNWGGSWRPEDGGFQDPHNSYLSVLHRTGLIGLMVFVALIGTFIARSLKTWFRIDDERARTYILGFLLSIICILGTSTFMVVLEGPYLGMFLWVAMGMIVAVERLNRQSILPAGKA